MKTSDSDAWHRFVDLYGPVIYGWLRRSGLDAQSAEDVGQEIFVTVAKNMDRYRHERERGTFRG